MSQPFIGEIRMFGGNFAPLNFAFCNGQLLAIAQNTALFSLLGTNYGGDGKSNFGLPNLQGSAPMHAGQGPGLTLRDLGETGGEQAVTLLQTEMPAHAHTAQVSTATDHLANPGGNAWGSGQRGMGNVYAATGANNVQMDPFGTSVAGGSLPHNNMPPYLVLNFVIALNGVFPSRN